ncbi:MAG: bifunctional fucokinase/L-fucose-1-P-guanylyltransferase [Tannerellaceae bacterium]|jgi:galactokinase/mevalonate kinase-like predicted kinase|nr:bifunctional fucokinase/L-fucose-1-P-guanylyltransferase [Tannerellaceae bacterium]
MKKLLSLPNNLVNSFHYMENLSKDEFFCASDPVGRQLGSGGGAAWLLDRCYNAEEAHQPFADWLAIEKRIILHAGGQSRRLPSYASSGKALIPVPVFRWERGQRLSQNLLSLQQPLYETILRQSPDIFRLLIASGDVYIHHDGQLPDVPVADVVCFGLWGDSVTATRHGVFLSAHEQPDELDYMLQKPTMEQLSDLSRSHFFLMDIGLWILSARAVEMLVSRSRNADGEFAYYDLYDSFGRSLGRQPSIADDELNSLSVKIVPLPNGKFYHYGTSPELIRSTLMIQNQIHDQRAIMHHSVKPHPAMFVQNATVDVPLLSANNDLWIENSHIGKRWHLSNNHILTGIPHNDWQLTLPPCTCIDIVPINSSVRVARPYGINDCFKGAVSDPQTIYLNRPLHQWLAERRIALPDGGQDIFHAPLFPESADMDKLCRVLQWMIACHDDAEGKRIWESSRKHSAADLLNRCDLRVLADQRRMFRTRNWPVLAANHRKSVFYQIDLDDAAHEYADAGIELPPPLYDEPVMNRIRNHAFRAQVLRLVNDAKFADEEHQAFSLLREALVNTIERKEEPYINVYRDQIVWSRSPVRIDLAGGWTDTPPHCLYSGGTVLNVAIELNSQPPLQVYIKPAKEYVVTLRSIDLGAIEIINTYEELCHYNKVGSPFSIPKAALALAGFSPQFARTNTCPSLHEQLKAFGAGIEITLLSAIPAGSGLGTSSILAATVLAALSDFCGLEWDKNRIGDRTLILEQLLTTGGGWQDQYGGILHGLKLLQTGDGLMQSPIVRWLPDTLFTDPIYRSCHLLYYTGITRTAKEILTGIVRGMFLNSNRHLRILREMKEHALRLFDVIQYGNFNAFGQMILKTWEQNQALDPGANPPIIQAKIIDLIQDYTLGYKLPGAGGGGYMYIVAKDPQAAARIRQILADKPPHPNARFVEMSISRHGLQTSRS